MGYLSIRCMGREKLMSLNSWLVNKGWRKAPKQPLQEFTLPGMTMSASLASSFNDGMTARTIAQTAADEANKKKRLAQYYKDAKVLSESLESMLICFQPESIREALIKRNTVINRYSVTADKSRHGTSKGTVHKDYIKVKLHDVQANRLSALKSEVYYNSAIYGDVSEIIPKVWEDVFAADIDSDLAKFIVRFKLENVD